jgi:hypothetical protein
MHQWPNQHLPVSPIRVAFANSRHPATKSRCSAASKRRSKAGEDGISLEAAEASRLNRPPMKKAVAGVQRKPVAPSGGQAMLGSVPGLVRRSGARPRERTTQPVGWPGRVWCIKLRVSVVPRREQRPPLLLR